MATEHIAYMDEICSLVAYYAESLLPTTSYDILFSKQDADIRDFRLSITRDLF